MWGASILSWLIGTKTGLYVLIGAAAVIAVGAVALWIWHTAFAAGAAGVAVAGLAVAAKANKARSSVKPDDQEAMKNDPFNRRRGR